MAQVGPSSAAGRTSCPSRGGFTTPWDARAALPCSSERSDGAKQALFLLNRAQSAFTHAPELNCSFLPRCCQLWYVLGSVRIDKVIQKYPPPDFYLPDYHHAVPIQSDIKQINK